SPRTNGVLDVPLSRGMTPQFLDKLVIVARFVVNSARSSFRVNEAPGEGTMPGTDKSAELVGRLERLPFSRWHRNLFVLCFLGVMFDACDFALFGMALPPVAREFGLNAAQAGLLATVGLIGAFLGALFWGTISDYIGRRTSFASTIGIFSLFTGLVGASWNVLSLAVFRFLSNFGLGGAVPVAL